MVVAFAGDPGVVRSSTGAFGAWLSFMYASPIKEQPETLLLAPVAFPKNVVVVFVGTGVSTKRPPEENCSAEPLAATGAEQSRAVKIRTVVPASDRPMTRGRVTLEGDPGSVRRSSGGFGGCVFAAPPLQAPKGRTSTVQ
jgi:hypothetical protein